ncbi:MAG: xanthine dehydrogenase family protein, partial [Deltaproteobacteria bacterium]|nr:xanthine dehydrogenase family protein [Deltaproteobacteria bacterium]
AKVTGQALYVDDIVFPGMLHGVTVRSPVARGKIRGIKFLDGMPWKEFTIVTAKDIASAEIGGKNHVALIVNDQPYLADGEVNHPEEPVVLLAHRDRATAEEARNFVKIEIGPLPAVFTIEDSLACKQVIWGKDNVFKEFLIEKGNPEGAWPKAAHVLEGEYETGAQEQLYIENNGMIAIAGPREGVTVWGSMQCPYYIHKALTHLFGLPAEKVRVIQTETGGGFGGKEEYPSVIAGHAALLAWKAGKPVKMIYDRLEDMVATTKRHPSRTKIRTAVDKNGKLLAMDVDFVIDGGAYTTLSPVVLSRGGIHAAGPYSCPNTRVRARAVATNSPPHGAFRGFGAPQSIFAMERHLDRAARAIGMSPERFRDLNLIRDGESTATGQVIKDHVDLRHLLDKALKLSRYHEKTRRYQADNAKGGSTRRGIGFACFMHGAGFTGSGERHLASIVGAEATREGVVRVLASSTEIGQGKNTVFSQIAADALGIDYDLIEVARPDTGVVPNSGPTVASRTCMVVGKLVETASLNLKRMLQQTGFLGEKFSRKDWIAACAAHHAKFGPLKAYSQYKQPPSINWDEVKYRGDAYATYAWAVYAADVAVDLVTYETRIEDFVALQEVGRVVHPVMAAGQIEGGVAQGIGYAMYEKVVYEKGRMINNQMTNYIIPTSMDVPQIRVFFEEQPVPYGPAGAKGIGELPMDGPAPAILNAVENALGCAVNRIPMTPEDLMRAMEAGCA